MINWVDCFKYEHLLFLQGLEICETCVHASHDVRVCNYLRCQRKVVADDIAQKILEGLRKNVKVVKKYRRILRILDKKENELYEYKGIVNHTDICWQRLAEETTGSSDV